MAASFDKAAEILLANEGGYANHPSDGGGETFRGVARNFWPDWPGWKVIDAMKANYPDFAARAKSNGTLTHMVKQFFKTQYWDPGRYSDFPSQDLANIVFDFAVLTGTGTAIRYLQTIVSRWKRISVDGTVGNQTIQALQSLSPAQLQTAYKAFRQERINHHNRRVQQRPDQEVFLKGWISRTLRFPEAMKDVSGSGGGAGILIGLLVLAAAGGLMYKYSH